MSSANSSGGARPRREKANLHPGRIVLEAQTKQCIPVEKQADDLHAKETQTARAAAIQQGHAWVSEMEANMMVEQAMQEAVKARPVKPKRMVSQQWPTDIYDTPHVNSEDTSC